MAVKPNINIAQNFILCTIHRAENTDNEFRLRSIFQSLEEISNQMKIILPLHPRTKKIVEKLNIRIANLVVVEPVGYLEMVWLIDNCTYVMTDSGGLQNEAYFFDKHCVTLREETEWVELVDNGFNTLVGANKQKILKAFKNLIKYREHSDKLNLYGRGDASVRIIKELLNYK